MLKATPTSIRALLSGFLNQGEPAKSNTGAERMNIYHGIKTSSAALWTRSLIMPICSAWNPLFYVIFKVSSFDVFVTSLMDNFKLQWQSTRTVKALIHCLTSWPIHLTSTLFLCLFAQCYNYFWPLQLQRCRRSWKNRHWNLFEETSVRRRCSNFRLSSDAFDCGAGVDSDSD